MAAQPVAEARALLKRFDVREAPVPVDKLAAELGAEISVQPLEGDVSGMLFRSNDRVVIGVNATESSVRRRFTIAHELGHLRLHTGRQLIVDKLVRVNLRTQATVPGEEEEREANAFAAELLMPETLVRQHFRAFVGDKELVQERVLVRQLAETFDVSAQAMGYRLVNLGLLSPMTLEG